MGQFLTILSREKKNRPQLEFFYEHSLTKVAEFYEQYKTISDTLAIDDSEFTEIFGQENLTVFEILDTDKNLLIDGLELFAGLVLYSKMIKFEDKVQFLFNLFDFNEQNSLFPNDIEFMFLSCCTFTHKIYGLKTQLNEIWIQEFVRGQFFNGEIKINISEILKWSKQSTIITIFFEEILVRPQTDKSSILDKQFYIKKLTSGQQDEETQQSLQVNQKLYQRFISGVKEKFQTFHEQKIEYSHCDVCYDINWTYGIRAQDVKKVMKVIESEKDSLQIVYLIGKVAVLFDYQSKSQRHYREHKRALISLEINEKRRIIATGEKGEDPSIRIWSYESLETVQVIKTSHINGIHIINFSKDGNFLVHVGSSSEGTLNIHDLSSNQMIYSFFCSTPIVDINELQNFTSNLMTETVITGLYEVTHISVLGGKYFEEIQGQQTGINQILVKENTIPACQFGSEGNPVSKITCSAFFTINRNFPYLNEYDDTYNKYILTGHQQGQVNVWNPDFKSFEFQLCQQKAQIIKIITTRDYIIILSDSSYISFWDIAIQKKQRRKVIDITEISYHLHSYNVRDLIPLKSSDEYLICTAKGDVFILGQQIKGNELSRFSMVEKDYEIRLIKQIFPIEGKVVTTKIIQKNHQGKGCSELFYGGQAGIIYTINLLSHLRIAAWNIGQKIVHFDVGESRHHGTIIVAATEANKIYTKINHVESKQKIQIKDNIVFVLLSTDTTTLIVSTNYFDQNNILIFMITPKLTYQLNNTIPMPEKIVYMELVQKKSLLCITQTNSIFLLSMKDLHYKPFDQIERSFPNPSINLVYWLKEKNNKYMPIIIGAQPKSILIARIDGTILCWRNQEELQLGSRVDLYAHDSNCTSLILNSLQNTLYSSGYSDNLITEWSLKFFIQKSSALSGHLQKIQQSYQDQDEFLERQNSFCIFRNNLLTETYDQHLLVRGIGSNNDTLTKLFKGMMQQWRLLNQTSPNIKDEPSIALKLDFVLGIQVFNKKQTVISLGNKRIGYFISRVVVIYDPNLNKQSLYTGHRFKVTCIVNFQSKNKEELIASGESTFIPCVHIWSTQTLETLRIVETSHRYGIINITIEGQKLLSYGFAHNFSHQLQNSNTQLRYQFQSINIWNDEQKAVLITKAPAYCMKIHPLKDQIVISTYGCITFYQNQFGFYRKKSICYVDDQHVTTMSFYEIKSNKRVEYDLLVGTRKGTIAMICQQKNFVVIKSKAHEQRINCLIKIKIQEQLFFVTTSQDQFIKIWSKKFQLIYFNEMKKNQSDQILKGNFDRKGSDISYLRNRAIQSLSIFSQSKNNSPTLLLGTRNGDIFQLIIQSDFSEKDPFRNSKYLLYLKNNITQSHLVETKKVLLAHHPKLEIIVTLGEDQNLLFWDTDASGGGNRFIFNKYLGYTAIPTAIKFTKDGDYLIIGFGDGLLIFLDSKITKSLQGKTDQKFLMPSLSLIKKEKAQQNSSILSIQLSDSGQYLAVSFNYKITMTKDKKSILSNSFIALFNNKSREKTKNISKLDSGKIFQKFTSIMCPYSESVYKTQKNSQYGMAAYSMSFAEGQGKFYLLIFYQLIDCFQNRLNFSTQGKYSVWDVSTSTMIANLDLIGSLSWKKLCFQNSIFSKYTFWKNLTEYKKSDYHQQKPINNNLYIPHMSALINIPNHLVLGSVNGDLHVVKSSALQFQGTNPQPKDMFIAKTYPSHCSEINQIEINPQKIYIYTTSTLDQCIFKYRIEGSIKINMEEQVFYENSDTNDIFNQVPTPEFQQMMLQIYESKSKLQSRKWIDTQNFLQKISIVQIIGRCASTIRQNLFIDGGFGIIYHVGQSIINWNNETKTKKFICYSNLQDTHLNQISQLHISRDNRSVIASYSGFQKSTILMWQNNCKSIQKKFFVNGITHVIIMTLNHDNSRIIIYGIDKKGKASLILIDFVTYQTLAVVSYSHKQVWSIKAIHFAEQSQNIFYTCGVEETKIWILSGNQLTYQQMPYDSNAIKKIIHLTMLVLNKTLITGGDDGSIFLWKNEVIKKQGHESMVTCLAKDRLMNDNNFYSGGKDGNFIVWSLQSNGVTMIKKVSILNILTPYQKHTSMTLKQASFSHEIQSINVFRSQIVIGTRNGNIYQTSKALLNSIHEQNPIRQLFTFHDFEATQALFFNPEETELYQISKQGFFSIWQIKQHKLAYSIGFREQTIDMSHHFRTNTIFIAFKKQLRIFYIQKDQQSNGSNQQSISNLNRQILKPVSYKLRELPQLSIAIKYITHLAFSNNQKMVSLGIESNSDKSISIQVYEVPQQIRSSRIQLKKLFKFSMNSPIQFADFSLNNKFLLICLIDSIVIRDLSQNKNINPELISKVQWCTKGVIYGKQSEATLNQWLNTWGSLADRKHVKSKSKDTNKSISLSKLQQGKKNIEQTDKKQKLSLEKPSAMKKTIPQINRSKLQNLTLLRLEDDKMIVIQKQGSVYVYQSENMVSKLSLPITEIDHFSLSPNKKYLAVACEIDKMIIIVDVSKCISKTGSKQ